MSEEQPPKKASEPDPMTELLRQMGLCEEEIEGALDLAEKIEKKIEEKPASEITSLNLNVLPKTTLITQIQDLKTQLSHFQNVVAPQFILMIKKYKDRVLSLENQLQQKNKKIEELSLKLEFLLK
ncbi:MAG: hypothetical protein EU536_03565 [Promethearchaeota archaeon]|nr:MAG: hypothetical protein EU536_03565 [Candidatus Lokiarchaeota archaeon]